MLPFQKLYCMLAIMCSTSKSNRIYRIVAVLGIIAAVALVLAIPDNFKEPDDWAYYYAAENLSHGRLVIDGELYQQQVDEAREQGGHLIQYIQIGPDEWVFEKAPGYVYFLIPFHLAGMPQMANILLAISLAAVTYLLLKRFRDEKLACLGVLLVLFTPVGLAMLQREYMDSFAGTAFLGIGGGLYILYCLRLSELKPLSAGSILFLAGLFLGCGVAIRYTNATVVAVVGLHFIITRTMLLIKGRWQYVLREVLPLGIGIAIPIGLLLLYHQVVFGSPWVYGYEYTKLNIRFAYDYFGQDRAWEIIATNMSQLWAPLLKGFPILVVALPAIAFMLFQKTTRAIPVLQRFNRKDYWPELSIDIFLLLIGWFIAVFGLYVMYEWTAQRYMNPWFIIFTRFYLPALLPIAICTSFFIAKLPNRLIICVISAIVAIGILFFVQSSSAYWVRATGNYQWPPWLQ